MSAKLVGQVWELDLPQQKAWLVMALADHADHQGGGIYVSVKMLVWKTGISERQVHRLIRELLDDKILVQENRRPGGRGHPNRYRLDLSRAPQKAPLSIEKGASITAPFKGCQEDTLSAEKRVPPEAEKGAKRVPGLAYARTTPEPENHRTGGNARESVTPEQAAKVRAVQAELDARNLPAILTGRDKTSIANCDADAETIVDAYETLRGNKWGDQWVRGNKSPGVAAANISTYLAWASRPEVNPTMSGQAYLASEMADEMDRLLGRDQLAARPHVPRLPSGADHDL